MIAIFSPTSNDAIRRYHAVKFATIREFEVWCERVPEDAKVSDWNKLRRESSQTNTKIPSFVTKVRLLSSTEYLVRNLLQWMFEASDSHQIGLLARDLELEFTGNRRTAYNAIRRSNGDWNSIDDSPGHIGTLDESDQLVTIAALLLHYGCGFSLWTDASSRSVHVDHDGRVWLVGGSASDVARFAEPLANRK
ncbi:MAG: hypothetical protein U0640_15325 [Phycisphaerales bacterium]